jgi:heat shock protein HslJ
MRIRAGAAAALLVLALAAACGGDDGEVVAEGTPPPADPAGEWRSTSVTEDGKARKLVEGTRVGLDFADGNLRAQAGCNTISGPVKFVDGHLEVGSLAMTEMGCPGKGRHEQDSWLSEFLGGRPAYTYSGDRLDLTSGGTRIELAPRELVEPDLPLEGTTWRVTHLTSGPPPGSDPGPDATVSAGAPGPAAGELTFEDGKVTGNAGCATFSGPAEVGEASIEIGELEVVRSGCKGEAATAFEKVVGVLAGTVAYRTSPHTLTLTHSSGRGLQLDAVKARKPTAGPTPSRTPGV